MATRYTVGEYLLEAIKQLGVSKVFGIPGDMVLRFFKVIEDDPDLSLYTFSHEPGVGFAAIGSARALKKPAVACITYGAGGLNMLNSVACAYAEKTPLIVLSGGPGEKERINNIFLHHMVKDFNSQLRIYKEVTQEAVILNNPKTAYQRINQALNTCREFMLPVYIEIPRDIVDEPIVITEENQIVNKVQDTPEKGIQEVADEILFKVAKAKTPVIIAGVETDRFDLKNSILLLAKKTNIPMVTTFLSRDMMPTENPHYFGTYLGLAGNPIARKLVEESDCLLMLGVIIADMNLGIKLTRIKPDRCIQSVSREVRIGYHTYKPVSLKSLINELLTRKIEPKKRTFPQQTKLVINKTCKYTTKYISIPEIIDAVNWFFSEFETMPVISDTGDCLFVSTKIETPKVMASAYYATMGFGTPAAIGFAVTTNIRPLVFLGDGSFQMTGQEMCHCPRFGINPIFMVFNNRRWGMQQLFNPTTRFNELVNWPYSKIAEQWGGTGYFCDTCNTLYKSLEKAKQDSTFSVIELMIEKTELSKELLAWLKELKSAKY